LYCGYACRRLAEFDIRRTQRHLERLEAELLEIEAGRTWRGRDAWERKRARKEYSEQIDALQAHLRDLVGADVYSTAWPRNQFCPRVCATSRRSRRQATAKSMRRVDEYYCPFCAAFLEESDASQLRVNCHTCGASYALVVLREQSRQKAVERADQAVHVSERVDNAQTARARVIAEGQAVAHVVKHCQDTGKRCGKKPHAYPR
jgi:hypothetical protein